LIFIGKNVKNSTSNPKKRNFGFGHKPGYSAKVALAKMFGATDHYYTRHTHYVRFLHLLSWLSSLDPAVKDLRRITLELVMTYAASLAAAVQNNEMRVSYAQNLLSTVNIVLLAVRQDRKIWLSPSQAVGKRSYVRTVLPDATWEKIDYAISLAEAAGNFYGAALLLMARAFGMRLREAALADLNRLKKEAELNGNVVVLEGTKGGRRSDDRVIEMGPAQWRALGYALNLISESESCLVDDCGSYRNFVSQRVAPLRKILKISGVRCMHDLRAERLIDVYEWKSGQQAPIKKSGPFDRDADLVGRAASSNAAGHGRPRIASSYIGKRHRKNKIFPRSAS
jgi:hypothetical protein